MSPKRATLATAAVSIGVLLAAPALAAPLTTPVEGLFVTAQVSWTDDTGATQVRDWTMGLPRFDAQPMADGTLGYVVNPFTVSYTNPQGQVILPQSDVLIQMGTDAGGALSAPIVLNPDPSIAWGFTVTNFLPFTTNFSFTFSTPLVPTVSGPTVVSSEISGGITDASGNNVSFAPTGASGFVQSPSLNPGAVPTGAPSGPAFSAPGNGSAQTHSYGLFSSGLLAGPGTGPYTQLLTTVAFSLSGNGDKVSLTGNATINPVPLPAAAWLLLGGIAGLGALARRGRAATVASA